MHRIGTLRRRATMQLIKLAMRTTEWGFTHDYLTEALREEKSQWGKYE